MKITVQVVLHADDDSETVVREAFTVHREALTPETVGLQLQEAKDLLVAVQDTLVDHQVTTALSAQDACRDCGMPRRHKDSSSYIHANAGRIPNYGERRRAGEAISTAFTESSVNQVIAKRMVKKLQMR